jgi:hypothetical protein
VAAASVVTHQRDDSEIAMNIRVLRDEYIRNSHILSCKKRENPQVDLTVSYMTLSKILCYV